MSDNTNITTLDDRREPAEAMDAWERRLRADVKAVVTRIVDAGLVRADVALDAEKIADELVRSGMQVNASARDDVSDLFRRALTAMATPERERR